VLGPGRIPAPEASDHPLYAVITGISHHSQAGEAPTLFAGRRAEALALARIARAEVASERSRIPVKTIRRCLTRTATDRANRVGRMRSTPFPSSRQAHFGLIGSGRVPRHARAWGHGAVS
jgi:hypothetical protein